MEVETTGTFILNKNNIPQNVEQNEIKIKEHSFTDEYKIVAVML